MLSLPIILCLAAPAPTPPLPFLEPAQPLSAAGAEGLRLSPVPPEVLAGEPPGHRWPGSVPTLVDSSLSVGIFHHLVLADRLVLTGDSAAALQHLEEALALDPLNPGVLERAARAAALAGDARRARQLWQVLASLQPDAPDIQYERWLAEGRDGRLPELDDLHRLARSTRHPGLLLLLLMTSREGLAEVGAPTLRETAAMARELHQRRSVLEALLPDAYAPVALWVLTGGIAEAQAALMARGGQDPSFWAGACAAAHPLLFAVDLAAQSGNTARLAEALDALAHIGADGPRIRLLRGKRLLDTGREEEGVALLRQVAETFSHSPPLLHDIGWMLMEASRPREAAPLFDQITRADRSNSRYRFAHACALAAQGQTAPALTQLRLVAEQEPVQVRQWLRGDAPYLQTLRERLAPPAP